MEKPPVFILWDASSLWGLLILRAMRQLDLNCGLISSKDIAQGRLWGKHDKNGLLIVPGGSARQKFFTLGDAGKREIRDWLAGGGTYLGICGGAGLALTQPDGKSLGICPWTRAGYSNRLFHLLSGHVEANTPEGSFLLPVWWPGRFRGFAGDAIQVLATYANATEDTYLADMPFKLLNSHLSVARELLAGQEGIFPAGQPLIVSENFGKGKYILSYSHLETPDSPDANCWLQRLLEPFGAEKLQKISDWQVFNDGNFPLSSRRPGFLSEMRAAYASFLEIASLARTLDFLYIRKSWLAGWRPGFPGMGINNLAASLAALSCLSDEEILPVSWQVTGERFKYLFAIFLKKAKECLWSYKLDFTLKHLSEPASVVASQDQMEKIFGKPMPGGGLIEDLSNLCASYIFETQLRLFA